MKRDAIDGDDFELPDDHIPGIPVPKGGSCCANCNYLRDDRLSCGNEYFQHWNGSPVIPAPIDAFCSDWYEPQPDALL